jgi:hypothetical protein
MDPYWQVFIRLKCVEGGIWPLRDFEKPKFTEAVSDMAWFRVCGYDADIRKLVKGAA